MKKDLIILIMSRMIQISASLISLRLMTTLLSENELGTYYLFISLYMFASLSVLNPYGQYINRNTYKWRRGGDLLSWLNKYIIFVMLFSVFFSIAWGGYQYFFHKGMSLLLAVIFCAYFVFITVNQFLLYTLNILDNRLIFSFLTILTAILGVLGSLFLLHFNLFDINKTYLWLLGIIIANFLSYAIAWIFLRRSENSPPNGNVEPVNYRDILDFCIPIAVSTFFLWIINFGYRFGVETLMGLAYLGIIAVAFTVSSQIMSVVESLIVQILQPQLFQKIDSPNLSDRIKSLNKYINETIAIYFCMAIFCSFFIYYIFLFLVDKKFILFSYIGIVAVWFDFFRISTNSLSMVFFSERNMKKMIFPYACGGIFLILLFSILSFLIKNNPELADAIPFIIATSSIVTFFICLIRTRMYGTIKIRLPFIFKRAVFITPVLVVTIFLPKINSINMQSLIIVGVVSLGYFLLFLMSILFVKYTGDK
ncbi:polysaccharide biosynthesis protein [Pectobacterium brasiliense]|uniref:lipopolysaccharide biosynthesis protein n=1 Tax=Pectobacterium brasiliense TaxID=180957 RepID=UPI001968AF6E|nr:polysaccharide biosynthesis protein [Pectobacterium brasiliense]MBN3069734.1 polysaccharide biosynthesis protein [Pectobacterium brasiliense]MBN3246784.1 polysaccharide biosynthesis protein [Pectobacterium brasiliense]